MTSIIVFKADKGNQLIVVGDRKHTYAKSSFESKKIFKLNEKLIFCGAGESDVINVIRNNILSQYNTQECENKLMDLINGAPSNTSFNSVSGITTARLHATDFLILGIEDLKVSVIQRNQSKTSCFDKIGIIGSGSEHIGWCDEFLNKLYQKRFDGRTKRIFFSEIIGVFSKLSKNDSYTGHPIIFGLDGYILEKGKTPKKIKISFDGNLEDYNKYKCEYNFREEEE